MNDIVYQTDKHASVFFTEMNRTSADYKWHEHNHATKILEPTGNNRQLCTKTLTASFTIDF